jgi:hypothetical protein
MKSTRCRLKAGLQTAESASLEHRFFLTNSFPYLVVARGYQFLRISACLGRELKIDSVYSRVRVMSIAYFDNLPRVRKAVSPFAP